VSNLWISYLSGDWGHLQYSVQMSGMSIIYFSISWSTGVTF